MYVTLDGGRHDGSNWWVVARVTWDGDVIALVVRDGSGHELLDDDQDGGLIGDGGALYFGRRDPDDRTSRDVARYGECP